MEKKKQRIVLAQVVESTWLLWGDLGSSAMDAISVWIYLFYYLLICGSICSDNIISIVIIMKYELVEWLCIVLGNWEVVGLNIG